MEENGSPPPVFETDENNTYFLCILPIHPLTTTVQNKRAIDETKDIAKQINDLSEINTYLSLSVSEIGDRDREAIKNEINDMTKIVLNYCTKPKSRDELFEKIGLYKNTKNFQNHIKPLIDFGWLNYTIPNKITSKDQKYYTTDLGEKLLLIVSEYHNSGIKRIPVVSSNIASVGYDENEHILEIEFHHRAVYQYFDVPEKIYEELMSSPSLGAYFMNEVKNKFKHKRK